MAESFLFNIVERVLEKLTILAIEEARLAFNVEDDLKKLQDTMISIKSVLLDAEQKQHHNEALSLCMWKLRDIFYDAEDVLDEFEFDALQKEAVQHPSSSTKVLCFSSCSIPISFSLKGGHKIKEINKSSKRGHKIKEINERLDGISTEWNRFNLGQLVENRHVIHRETHSFVNSSDVIGRDGDKENIIDLLMKPSDGGNIPVIPIVGIGGLGKTTLAQFVYNDQRVTSHFSLRIWVCVSEEFDVSRLLRDIIYSITSERCDGVAIDSLQTRLRSLLQDKKFFLVLDDVWNEDRVKWIELRNLLMSMGNSAHCKIIVTTRSLEAALVMSSDQAYELKGLPHKDCLTLFTKWAFNDGDERQYENLMKIGEEIVEKCKGVPLAVRTLGSLLYMKRDEREWKSIKDSEIWTLEQSDDGIIPALKLSYYKLPSYLQRCLAYLSLYRKDTVYVSHDVIQFWMANRLLEHPKHNDEWEDVGVRFLNELRLRCFIQDVEVQGCYFTFKLHDLIHDLALDVSQKDCRSVNCPIASIDEKVRHLSMRDYQLNGSVPEFVKKLKNVRTIVGEENHWPSRSKHWRQALFYGSEFINFCISNFKYLRALDLSYSFLEVLPDSIGTLKLLKYIDLRDCRRLRKLPSSFYKLQSLLMLNIRYVPLMQVPDNMQNLIRLRYLEITFKEHWGLRQLIQPGCWSSLQYLCLCGCYYGNIFDGIEYLTSLRTLYVYDSSVTSLPQSLTRLTKLEQLQIDGCHHVNLRMEPANDEVLQDLHWNLKMISISESEALTELPRWLLEGSASTLQCIRLDRCWSLEALPAWLQNLTSLQKLEISECRGLTSLPKGMDRLTGLRKLKIQSCSSMLTERCQRDGGADWPKIAHIHDLNIQY